MNWLSALLISVVVLVPTACGAPASGDADTSDRYQVDYTLRPEPETGSVLVSMKVSQSDDLLRIMSFDLPEGTSMPSGDGRLELDGRKVRWHLPENGGQLSWRVALNKERGSNRFDAYLSKEWGIFRAEDVIPRASTRTLKNASGDTSLSFELPPGWTTISEYSDLQQPRSVVRPGRRFSQPTGWMAVGLLGIRRETIAGTRVAIAGPQGHSVRRMDMLALLNWTLPEVAALLGETPERLTVISAGEPMWRGGLSAPQSIFIHADRPLISENATSTLLHEVMHVALRFDAAPGFDWVVEGFAEYYSLELLQRGGAITARRHARAIESQREWGLEAELLCAPQSSGPSTALAVSLLRDLDKEIRNKTNGKSSLDDLAVALRTSVEPVDIQTLRRIVSSLIDAESVTLRGNRLPGCEDL